MGVDGLRDDTDEDYKALGRRALDRGGTGYLSDRKVPSWSLDGFLDALS